MYVQLLLTTTMMMLTYSSAFAKVGLVVATAANVQYNQLQAVPTQLC